MAWLIPPRVKAGVLSQTREIDKNALLMIQPDQGAAPDTGLFYPPPRVSI